MAEHGSPAETAPEGTYGTGYERRDTNSRMVVGFGVGLVVILFVVMLGLRGLLGAIARGRGPIPAENAPPSVREELRQLRAEEQSVLGEYGRIDQEPGYAHIPIDRAMELMVEKGVPFGKGRKTEVEVNTRVKQ